MSVLLDSDLYPVFLFLFILFVVFWIYSLLWVAKDISWRTTSLRFQVLCIVLVALLSPLLGLPVYFLLRPVQRYDTRAKREEDEENEFGKDICCASCGTDVEPGFEFCPYCGDKATKKCPGCQKIVPLDYHFCPYCGNGFLIQ